MDAQKSDGKSPRENQIMATRYSFVLLGLSLLVLAGCGSSEPSGGDANAQNPADKSPVVKSDGLTPEQVVTIFLESLHTGNDERMKQMFTAAARGNHGLAAEKSNTKFEVFEANFYDVDSETVAYVLAPWTTYDENGQEPHTDSFKWALRKMPEGWRISGVATLIPILDDKWVPLNFEKPEEMEAIKEQVAQEIARRPSEQPAASVAENPNAPGAPVQR